MVADIMGAKIVTYYLFTEDGLKDENTGIVYYSKAGLAALEKKKEEKRKREKEEEAKKEEMREKEREEEISKAIEKLEKTMVLVKGGCFEIGNIFGDIDLMANPVGSNVCLDDFYIGETEVTQALWEEIMGNNPSYFKGSDRPVESVSWNDIQKFIFKLNKKTGKKFRLPREVEWEYAARSGGKKEKWAGTSKDSDLGAYAWYSNNSGNQTHPVKQKKPNALGLYDMSGNVNEWVNGFANPAAPPFDWAPRVARGGSWMDDLSGVRAAIRYGLDPGYQHDSSGFRLALSPSVR